jgi:hypothetical protein
LFVIWCLEFDASIAYPNSCCHFAHNFIHKELKLLA